MIRIDIPTRDESKEFYLEKDKDSYKLVMRNEHGTPFEMDLYRDQLNMLRKSIEMVLRSQYCMLDTRKYVEERLTTYRMITESMVRHPMLGVVVDNMTNSTLIPVLQEVTKKCDIQLGFINDSDEIVKDIQKYDGIIVAHNIGMPKVEYDRMCKQFIECGNEHDISGYYKESGYFNAYAVAVRNYGQYLLWDKLNYNPIWGIVGAGDYYVGKPLTDLLRENPQNTVIATDSMDSETIRKISEVSDIVVVCANKPYVIDKDSYISGKIYIDCNTQKENGEYFGCIHPSLYEDGENIVPASQGINYLIADVIIRNLIEAYAYRWFKPNERAAIMETLDSK